MSYGRDRDAHTRGSGAIASLDYGNPRRAAMRRAKLARSAALDRQRAQLTYGSRGGMPMGAAAVTGVLGPGGSVRRPMFEPGGAPPEGTPIGSRLGLQIGVIPPAPPKKPFRIGVDMTALTPSPGKWSSGTKTAPFRAGVDATLVAPTMLVIDPITGAGAGTTTPPGKKQPYFPGGGGGGGGGSSGGSSGGGEPPIPTLPPLPEMTAPPDAVPATGMSSTTKLLLLGALLGGAWLLLKDDKDGEP